MALLTTAQSGGYFGHYRQEARKLNLSDDCADSSFESANKVEPPTGFATLCAVSDAGYFFGASKSS